MSKLVVFQINKNLNKNYWVNLKISVPDREPFVQVGGTLPLANLGIEQYQKWRKNYQQLNYFIKLKAKLDRVAYSIGTEVDNYIYLQKQKCKQDFILLKERVDRWLKSPGFRHISQILREHLNKDEDILFLISTSSLELRQLPWHLWSIIQEYPLAEIILSPKNELLPNPSPKFTRYNLKILAIINNIREQEFFKYKQELIERFFSAKITFIYQANRQKINEFLRKNPWDILFFHNCDRVTEYKKILDSSENENINIDSIEYGLKIARDNGLQLAIFNIRDSWEAIPRLEKINIPNSIIMREAVSERAAHKFFIYFLEDLISNKSLPLAVCSARKKLRQIENLYYDPSWFPLIYQNYAPGKRNLNNNNNNNNNIGIEENRYNLNLKVVNSMSNNGLAIETKQETTNKQEKTFNSIKTAEGSKSKKPQFLLDDKDDLLEIKEVKQQDKQAKQKRSRRKINLISLISLIFIGTKIYTIILSFILVRFFENSNRYLDIGQMNRQLPEIYPTDSNYQKKAKFSEIEGVPRGLFRYGGSASWTKIRKNIHPAIESVWPDFNLVYTHHPTQASNSDIAVKMLLDSQLSFAQISRPLTPAEHQAALEKNTDWQQIPIAIDAIVFTVNPALNISGLTLTQLKDIYTGKITNWQQLGGPNLKITPYSKSPLQSGTADFFSKHILGNSRFSKNVKIVNSIPPALQAVSNNKGAIFYASASHIIGQCSLRPLAIGRNSNNLISPYQGTYIKPQKCPDRRNQLNLYDIQNSNYPLSRYLYVIVKRNSFFDRIAGEAYVNLLIAREGQQLIRESGFVPIY